MEMIPAKNFEVIFVTAFDKYALKAIKFCALDYILKPLNIKELVKAVSLFEERRQQKFDNKRMQVLLENISTSKKRIVLPLSDKMEFVEVDRMFRLIRWDWCTRRKL